MFDQPTGMSPEDPRHRSVRIRGMVDFWSDFDVCGEAGATTLEVIEALRQDVTECLSRNPPDVEKAESLTARALLLIAGRGDP